MHLSNLLKPDVTAFSSAPRLSLLSLSEVEYLLLIVLFFHQVDPSTFAAKLIDRSRPGQHIYHTYPSEPELSTAAPGANATEAAADPTAETLPGEEPDCPEGCRRFSAGNACSLPWSFGIISMFPL